jgi:hypothetical protein
LLPEKMGESWRELVEQGQVARGVGMKGGDDAEEGKYKEGKYKEGKQRRASRGGAAEEGKQRRGSRGGRGGQAEDSANSTCHHD